MFLLGSRNPWSYSQGFNMMVDFCVWALEADGLHVPPFDQHPDGDGSLRAVGLDAAGWQTWLARVVNLQYEQQQRHQQRALNNPFQTKTQVDWQALFIPEAQNPPASWQGDAAVGQRLAELWEKYGPISNERNSWEFRLSRQWQKAEAQASKRLYDELKPYHTRIPTLVIHLVDYAQPLDYLILPVSVVMSANENQPDAAEFRERVLAAAAELSASDSRRNPSTYTLVPLPNSNPSAPRYKTYPRKPVIPAAPRPRVHLTAETQAKQLILDKFGDERSHLGEANMATFRFLKEKTIPGWQMHYVTFEEIDGDQQNLAVILRQREDGSWSMSSASTNGNVQEMVTRYMEPVHDHPLIFMSGGKGGHAPKPDGTAQHEFVAHGDIIDNGFAVTRVRLVNDAGQTFEDTVQDGLVLFACMQAQEVQFPMQAELYTAEGKLVWRETVFDNRPPSWLKLKKR